MKRVAILSVFYLLFCFLSPSCKKTNSISESPKEGSIELAQQWYEQQANHLKAKWSETIIARDRTRLLVPLDWKVDLEDGAKAFRILVIHLNKVENAVAVEVVEIIPTTDYWTAYGTQFIKAKFSGTLVLYDQNLKFKYGQYFEDGEFKYPAIIQRFKEKIDLNELNAARNCSWMQSSYVENGVFTVVNTLTCTIGGGSIAGGESGMEPPVNCKIDPDSPNNCTGGSSSGSGEDALEPTGPNDVSCASFEFRQTDPVNWQEAGVNKIRLQWVWSQGPVRIIEVNHIVFGLPMSYVGGKTLTPSEAAIMTSIMVQRAKLSTYFEFDDAPYNPDDNTVINFFIAKLSNNMKAVAGTAGKTGSGNPNIIFRDEQRSMSPYECY